MGSEPGVGWRAKWSDRDLEENVKIIKVFDRFPQWFLMALRDVIFEESKGGQQYQYTISVHSISTQYQHSTSTQYKYTVSVHSISTQYQYTVQVHSIST